MVKLTKLKMSFFPFSFSLSLFCKHKKKEKDHHPILVPQFSLLLFMRLCFVTSLTSLSQEDSNKKKSFFFSFNNFVM